MHNIFLDTTEIGFILSYLPYEKLKLQFNESNLFIEKFNDSFVIEKNSLYSLAHHEEHIIKISGKKLGEKAYNEIDLTDFSIKSDSSLHFSYKENDYYLYVSQQNTLRIIANQKPSVMSYYKRQNLTILDESKNKITFQLNVTSSYFKFINCIIFIKERNKKNETSFSSTLIDCFPVNSSRYVTIFEFSISKDILKTLYPLNFNYTSYDTVIFDLYFTLSIQEQPITDYAIRLQYFEFFTLDEHWIDLDNSYKILVRTYPTTNYQNLSFRISIVPSETYHHYQKMNKKIAGSKETNKKIILITEYPHKAQDTGLKFFEYMYKDHSKEYDVYYIISKDSKDLPNLKEYKNNILFYKSKKHLQLFFEADVLAHSHNSLYGFPFVTDFMLDRSKTIFKVFLQHGLQSVRDVSYLYGKKPGIPFTNLFIVSSNREKEIVINNYSYNENEVAITGLSRFDSLLSPTKVEQFPNKKILIMPSWRKNQDKLSDQEFTKTQFFKSYQSLLHNQRLREYSFVYEIDVVFYLHTNFQKYSHLFKSDFIKIIKEGDVSVQNLLKSSNILITDFSSVSLDFALLKKPILYYQFDGSPIEAKKDDTNLFFPGTIVSLEEELINELWFLKPDSVMKPKHENYLPDLYKFDDTFACQRIYDEINSRTNN